MLRKFIHLCLIFILIGGGYILYKQPNLRNQALKYSHISVPNLPAVKGINLPAVKGISTGKSGSISGQLKSEVNNTINSAEKQALNLKVSDLVNFFNRAQKIGKDARSFQDYVKQQLANFGKK